MPWTLHSVAEEIIIQLSLALCLLRIWGITYKPVLLGFPLRHFPRRLGSDFSILAFSVLSILDRDVSFFLTSVWVLFPPFSQRCLLCLQNGSHFQALKGKLMCWMIKEEVPFTSKWNVYLLGLNRFSLDMPFLACSPLPLRCIQDTSN